MGTGKFPEEEDQEPLSNEAKQRASSLLQSVVSESNEMINMVGRLGKRTAWKKSLKLVLVSNWLYAVV